MIFVAIIVAHLTTSTLTMKSPNEWTSKDVNSWLGSLGPWAQVYVDRFEELGINGLDLLQLTDADLLDDPLNMRNNLHRRIFFERRQNLNEFSSEDSSEQNPLDKIMSKPLNKWSTEDVTLWVESLDVWSKVYADRFNESEINGIALMQLKEEYLLDRSISMRNDMHRRKFMEHLKRLTRQYLDKMLTKPHTDWSPVDVKLWVASLGLWSKGYADKFHELGIDGTSLMRIKESDLLSPAIDMNRYWHRRMFIQHLGTLNIVLRSPGLWEYKDANNELALFILLGIRYFPRSTLAYLYVFNYADTFLPFFDTLVAASNKEETVEDFSDGGESSSTSWANVLLFIPQFLFLPYYLVLRFASYYLEANYWTSRVVLAHAALLTLEGFSIANLPHLVFKPLFYVGVFSLFSQLVFSLLPLFLTNVVFYWFLYVSPFITLNRMRKRLVGRRTERRIENN